MAAGLSASIKATASQRLPADVDMAALVTPLVLPAVVPARVAAQCVVPHVALVSLTVTEAFAAASRLSGSLATPSVIPMAAPPQRRAPLTLELSGMAVHDASALVRGAAHCVAHVLDAPLKLWPGMAEGCRRLVQLRVSGLQDEDKVGCSAATIECFLPFHPQLVQLTVSYLTLTPQVIAAVATAPSLTALAFTMVQSVAAGTAEAMAALTQLQRLVLQYMTMDRSRCFAGFAEHLPCRTLAALSINVPELSAPSDALSFHVPPASSLTELSLVCGYGLGAAPVVPVFPPISVAGAEKLRSLTVSVPLALTAPPMAVPPDTSLVPSLMGCRALRRLVVPNAACDALLIAVASLPCIQHVEGGTQQPESLTDRGLLCFSGKTTLRHFTIDNASFSAAAFAAVLRSGAWRRATALQITAVVHEDLAAALGDAPALETLIMRQADLDDGLCRSLSRLLDLRTLTAGSASATSVGEAALLSLTKLSRLYVLALNGKLGAVSRAAARRAMGSRPVVIR